MKDTINNETEDLYFEHATHFKYEEKCSTCFSNVKEFDEEKSNCCDFPIINGRCSNLGCNEMCK